MDSNQTKDNHPYVCPAEFSGSLDNSVSFCISPAGYSKPMSIRE